MAWREKREGKRGIKKCTGTNCSFYRPVEERKVNTYLFFSRPPFARWKPLGWSGCVHTYTKPYIRLYIATCGLSSSRTTISGRFHAANLDQFRIPELLEKVPNSLLREYKSNVSLFVLYIIRRNLLNYIQLETSVEELMLHTSASHMTNLVLREYCLQIRQREELLSIFPFGRKSDYHLTLTRQLLTRNISRCFFRVV